MTEPAPTGKDWARQIIALYSEGYSDAEVAAEMKYTIKDYYKQIADNVTFARLVEFGRTLCLAWWEGQARKNLNNKQFNTPLWVFTMKNKYGWADKVETRNENENTQLDLDSLRAQVAREVAAFTKLHSPELTDAQRVLQTINQEVKDEQEN